MTSLANRARAGDPARFDALYEAVAPSLYAWASLRAPSGCAVDDLMQEIWLRAVRALRADGVPEFGSFRAWIFQVARHVLLEVLREHVRQRRVARETPSALDQRSAHVTSISMRLASDDALRAFLDHARALPPDDLDLLVYCGLEGQPCNQVAVRVGLDAEAAWKRWQRLRARLRDSAWTRILGDAEG